MFRFTIRDLLWLTVALTNRGLEKLRQLPRLRSVDVSRTAVDNYVADWLARTPAIDEVFLQGIEITQPNVEMLKTRRPTLRLLQ